MKWLVIIVLFSLSIHSLAQVSEEEQNTTKEVKTPGPPTKNIHLGIGFLSAGPPLSCLNFRGYINLTKHFRFASAFNLPVINRKYNFLYDIKWKADANFHYITFADSKVSPYGIFGISVIKNRAPAFPVDNQNSFLYESQSNLGVGAEIRVNKK